MILHHCIVLEVMKPMQSGYYKSNTVVILHNCIVLEVMKPMQSGYYKSNTVVILHHRIVFRSYETNAKLGLAKGWVFHSARNLGQAESWYWCVCLCVCLHVVPARSLDHKVWNGERSRVIVCSLGSWIYPATWCLSFYKLFGTFVFKSANSLFRQQISC